ncbi:MAG: hypothetical protein LBJ89_04485, partial [Holosporales bacterium]|nr:hypothetical protein [Holosporales bacterium]
MKKILITVGCLLSSNAFSSGKTLWRSAKDLYYDAMNSEVPDIIKFNAAMTMAVSAAKEGNAKALNLLGENFWWVQHSDLQTSQLSLFKLSADKGDERGLFNYGKLLIETSKTPSDFDCGMEYIRLSVGKRTPGGKRICVEALVAFSFHLLDNGHSERAIFYLELAANVKPSQFRIPIHA